MRPIKLLAPTLLAAALAFPAASHAALITHSSAFWSQHAHFSKVRVSKRGAVPAANAAGCNNSASTGKSTVNGRNAVRGNKAVASSFKPRYGLSSSRWTPKPATPLPCATPSPEGGSGTPPADVAELLSEVFGSEPFNETETPPPSAGEQPQGGNDSPTPPENPMPPVTEPLDSPPLPTPPAFMVAPPDLDGPAEDSAGAAQVSQVPEPESLGLLGLGLAALGYQRRRYRQRHPMCDVNRAPG